MTSIRGHCGKPNCRCHTPNHPGHGPNFRLSRKRNGKTVSETFSNAADLQKAQREAAEFRRFPQLARDPVEVNEQIYRPLWTARGASAITALRACRLSGRPEDYWESRRRAV